MMKALLALLFICVATLGVASNANATVALCVGCTTQGQFESAAWQAEGTNFIGERTVLVVNPDTGLSNWVYLTHYPPGTSIRAKPVSQVGKGTTSLSYVQTGVAIPLDSNPFSAIYIAGTEAAHVNTGGGISDASAGAVSGTEQAAINTAIKLTRHTYIVRLDPSQFPSYYGSQPERIGPVNYSALANAGIGWPPRALLGATWTNLLKALKLYTGFSGDVCDVFGNGDSACFVPDPQDPNIVTQDGPAKDANGNVLQDITERVAGGGGGGMVVRRNTVPSQVLYFGPGSGGGGSHMVCGYVNGVLSACTIKQE